MYALCFNSVLKVLVAQMPRLLFLGLTPSACSFRMIPLSVNGWLRTGNRRQRTGRCWRQFRRRWWQPPRKSADAGTVGARGGEAFAKLFPKLSCRERRQNIQDLCRWKMLAWQKGTVFCHPAGGSFGVARQIIMDKGRPPLILSKP